MKRERGRKRKREGESSCLRNSVVRDSVVQRHSAMTVEVLKVVSSESAMATSFSALEYYKLL